MLTPPTRPEDAATAPTAALSRRVAAVLVAVAGLLHLILVPEYLAEAPLLGVSFLAGAAVTAWAAMRLWRADDLPAWLIGAAVAAGMLLGFLASRTVGLFGYASAEWAEGVPSLVVEAAFLTLAARRVPALLRR